MTSDHRSPIAAAFASMASVQIGAAFAKTLFPLVGPEGVAALRIGLAAMMLSLAFRPWRLSLARADWRNLLLYGAMIGGMNLLIYRAFAYIPIGVAISIEVLGPLGVALLASRRKIDLLWIVCAALGVALLPFGAADQGLDWRGVAFALAAALCWGVYVVVGGAAANFGGAGVAIGMTAAALLVLPFGLAHAGAALLTPQVLAFGFVVAVLSSALPFLLDAYALKRLPRQMFGVLMSASPAVSALAGFMVLGERLSLAQWGGVLAITLACVGAMSVPAKTRS